LRKRSNNLNIRIIYFQTALGAVHISSRGNVLAQKRACCVENARKVFNLAVLFALHPRFCLKVLLADEL
jgi:hypothetical protein